MFRITGMPSFKIGFPWTFGESVESFLEVVLTYLFVTIIGIVALALSFIIAIVYTIWALIMYGIFAIENEIYDYKERKKNSDGE